MTTTALPCAAGKRGEIHRGMVAALVASGAKAKGFRASVEKAFRFSDDDRPRWTSIVPDAYEIHPAGDLPCPVVIVHEVIVTHPLTDAKLAAYADLWFDLDNAGIDLVLIVHSPFLHEPERISLMNEWYRIVDEQTADWPLFEDGGLGPLPEPCGGAR